MLPHSSKFIIATLAFLRVLSTRVVAASIKTQGAPCRSSTTLSSTTKANTHQDSRWTPRVNSEVHLSLMTTRSAGQPRERHGDRREGCLACRIVAVPEGPERSTWPQPYGLLCVYFRHPKGVRV
mmetsp:Transcript_63879/g.118756  ORF Transcript_63879/g.118756 Transcript_63879/m.118756 type:complete len:124 (+) Transcript_63879:138-509(+)